MKKLNFKKIFLQPSSILLCFIFLAACGNDNITDVTQAKSKTTSDENIQVNTPLSKPIRLLSYEVVGTETLKKGGQLEPLIRPKYNLILVRAALTESYDDLDKTRVENTLRSLLTKMINQHQADAISIELFLSKESISDPSSFFAEIEWWPKGHSLSPKNVDNINNKSTYETRLNINLPRKVAEDKIVTRLSEAQRRDIFKRKAMAELLAIREADKRYPLDTLKQIEKNSQKNLRESEKLGIEYGKVISKEFNLTEEEDDKISAEGFYKNWPLK